MLTVSAFSRWLLTSAAVLLLLCQSGCTFLSFPIRGTRACRLPPEALAIPKRGLMPINPTKLEQPKPEVYRLAPGDILGIYIPGVIPYQDPLAVPSPPPIFYPSGLSDLPPSIGVPFVVLENGNVTLPSLKPIPVDGLTVEEATEKIRAEYEEAKIIRDENTVPLVSLFRPRTYSVTVIREDTGRGETSPSRVIELPAYKNDVLHALMATGGLPGLSSQDEVQIFREASTKLRLEQKNELIMPANELGLIGPSDGFGGPSNAEAIDPPPVEIGFGQEGEFPDTVIPLQVYEGMSIDLPQQDIILNDGDIVYIPNRAEEVFYTLGGLIQAGEYPLPRDYDIDIFEALAIAGVRTGSAQGRGGIIPEGSGVIPTRVFVIRERPDGSEFAIKIDLQKAVHRECERILIQPGDKITLRYTADEELLNFGVAIFFAYIIRYIFQGINGN